MLRTAMSRLGTGISIWTVVHYAFCAFAIAMGMWGLVWSGLDVVFGVGLDQTVVLTMSFWVGVAGIFIGELLYRPSGTLTAGIGFFALLALCTWFAGNILVSAIL
jgi:hypothetical protein